MNWGRIHWVERSMCSDPLSGAVAVAPKWVAQSEPKYPKAGIERVSYQLVPSSPMGKAIRYFHDQWPRIEEIFRDGRYERTTT